MGTFPNSQLPERTMTWGIYLCGEKEKTNDTASWCQKLRKTASDPSLRRFGTEEWVHGMAVLFTIRERGRWKVKEFPMNPPEGLTLPTTTYLIRSLWMEPPVWGAGVVRRVGSIELSHLSINLPWGEGCLGPLRQDNGWALRFWRRNYRSVSYCRAHGLSFWPPQARTSTGLCPHIFYLCHLFL